MLITLCNIKIKDIAKNYVDNKEEGVFGFDNKLNIRPKYQREFVYKDNKKEAVIDSILQHYPLNIMYWARNQDGTYEVLDGQQRTISICQYVTDCFAITNERIGVHSAYFSNLSEELKNEILNYELTIYVCEGPEHEKLEWFRTINIAGEPLTEQELLNATYSGPFISDAKRYFSKTNCAAYLLAKDYVTGSPIRQDFLETALRWIAHKENTTIENYMGKHQNNKAATALWNYFQKVIAWIKITFPKYRKEMKGIDWGILYNEFSGNEYDTDALETRIQQLMADDDVSNKKGIYLYVLNGKQKHLNIRTFTESMKRSKYEQQGGVCPHCGKTYEIHEMEGDHIVPWHLGGKTLLENLQMLCVSCNRTKSGK